MHDRTEPHRWRDRALCRHHDPDDFFPVGVTGPALEQIKRAKAVCATPCPVVAECLAEALSIRGALGVWGNTDEADRARLVRAYRREQVSA